MAAPLDACKNNVTELLTRRDVFMPKESAHHLHVIDNYIDHIHLDNTFLTGSKNWASRQDQTKLRQYVAGASQAVQQTNSTVNGLKTGLTVKEASTMPDNVLRQHTFASNQSLHTTREDLHPYGCASRERIQQFSDLLGVTDRFTGYRNNMSRNRYTFKLNTDWARKSMPEARVVYSANEHVPHRNNERFNLAHGAQGGANTQCAASARPDLPQLQSRDDSIWRRDWRTDYTIGYAPKIKPPYGKPFPLNPAQDFLAMTRGRPLAPQSYDKRATEYADRYITPRSQLDTHNLTKSS